MLGLPTVTDRSDPANRAFMIAALVATPILLAVTVFVQQFLRALNEPTLESTPLSLIASERIDPPELADFSLRAKYAVKHACSDGIRPHAHPAEQGESDAEFDEHVLEIIDEAAVTRTQRLRAAMAAGYVGGTPAAESCLKELTPELDPEGELAADAQWLAKLYSSGPSAVTDDAREALIERHGWFARLALAATDGLSLEERRELLRGPVQAGMLALFHVGFIGVSLLIGLVAAVVWIRKVAQGEWAGQFDAPAVGGTVYLEAVGLFLAGFILSQFMAIPFRTVDGPGLVIGLAISEVLTWSLLGTAFWPLLRGVRFDAFCVDVGLHRGEGFAMEVGCGVLAFFAEQPVIYALGFLIELTKQAFGGATPEIETFPLHDDPLGPTWGLIILGALGAVVWVPVVEELIVRGALYRAVHARLRFGLSVLVTAVFFGVIHPYGLDGILVVAVGGAIYALLREWRGSLIACMTAHLLHNAVITGMDLGWIAFMA
jgi:membrane protease YdiL (CAAX protease family)